MKAVLKIGLTYTGAEHKHQHYEDWITAGDERIGVIKLCSTLDNLDLAASMDALVISGGVDVHPVHYGGAADYANKPERFNEQRDAFEAAVFSISQQHRIPLLGICRGMQLINCLLGGTLTQDLGPAHNAIHRRTAEADKLHQAAIVPGTLLNSIAGVQQEVVNSAHHQCVNVTGSGLLINARSPEGIPEGMEWAGSSGKSFFLGVQWHPERMYQHNLGYSPLSRGIRNRFVQAAIKNKKQ